MFFKYYPQFDVNIFYVNVVLDIILEIIFISILLYIIIILYFKKKKTEKKRNIINLGTWILFFLLLGIGHFIKISISILTFNNTVPELMLELFEKIDIALIFIAFLIRVFYVEYVINTWDFYRGYYFSLIISFTLTLVLLVDLEDIKQIGTSQNIFLIITLVGYSILPVLYLFLSLKTKGKSRKIALKVSLGITLLGVGSLFQSDNLIGIWGYDPILNRLIEATYITGPITVIIATLLIFDSFRKEEMDDSEEGETFKAEEILHFTKPVKITEEEIKFYREQTICLVCKGKLGGFNVFLCAECKALYCESCALALSRLENMCWVCDAPLDESKPIKPPVETEEIISTEVVGALKNGKES
jgi:hypothetical protein